MSERSPSAARNRDTRYHVRVVREWLRGSDAERIGMSHAVKESLLLVLAAAEKDGVRYV